LAFRPPAAGGILTLGSLGGLSMSAIHPGLQPPPKVYYPDSDGEPMADNTVQFDWIAILKWNAEAYLRDDPNVFVAGDHLIYPIEGDADTRQAPDVYVAFGRPKGDRGSYKVWEEGGIFPQVVIEVWSPNNRYNRMRKKFAFYEKFGADEYYIVYPEFPAHLEGWRREGDKLVEIETMDGHVSPRLGFKFAVKKGVLTVTGPDGRPLKTPTEIARDRDEAEQRLADERRKADKLAAKLRELGIDPDQL
jgi:Uma2 family endonuclease